MIDMMLDLKSGVLRVFGFIRVSWTKFSFEVRKFSLASSSLTELSDLQGCALETAKALTVEVWLMLTPEVRSCWPFGLYAARHPAPRFLRSLPHQQCLKSSPFKCLSVCVVALCYLFSHDSQFWNFSWLQNTALTLPRIFYLNKAAGSSAWERSRPFRARP